MLKGYRLFSVLLIGLFLGGMAACGGGGSDNGTTLQDLPRIEVTYPPRAATIQGSSDDLSIQVAGTVSAGAGALSSFTINGDAVTVDAGGSFSHSFSVIVGGNTLVMDAVNTGGLSSKRVQAFTWSTAYERFDDPLEMSQASDPGVGIWLSQAVIDDGDHSHPPDDLATLVENSFAAFDLGSLVDPSVPIASGGGYNIYLTSLGHTNEAASMTVINGGLDLTTVLTGIHGDLFFDCPCSGVFCGCWYTGGDSSGDITMSSISFTGDLLLDVSPDHLVNAALSNSNTDITGLNISSDDGWTDFLISVVETFISGTLVSGLESELNNQVVNEMTPVIEDVFETMMVGETLIYPPLYGDAGSVSVEVVTDYSSITPIAGEGIEIAMRMGAWADPVVSHVNLGVPVYDGCGAGSGPFAMPGSSSAEAAFYDDAVNQQLHAQWRGGRFEFEVPTSAMDLNGYSFTNASITVSGMLAPTVSDCNAAGEFRVLLGDLRLDVSLINSGVPIDAVAWAALECDMVAGAAGSWLTFTPGDLQSLAVGLDVLQDGGVSIRGDIQDLVEDYLVNGLLADLAAGPMVRQRLPQLDLSNAPGGELLIMSPGTITRESGNTVAGGVFQ